MRAPYWVRAGGAIVVSLMLADPAWAGVDEGVASYNRGDYVTAVHEFRLLAEQGDAIAQFNLGVMYAEGNGVPQDYVQSHKWFNLAASRYLASEKECRDRAVNNRELIAANMTPARTYNAQWLARVWWPK